MKIENISIIIIGILSLILSLYTFTRGKNKAASKLYSVIIFFAGPIWSLSIALFRESTTVDSALLWNKIIYIVATVIPALTFTFSKLFPKRKNLDPGLLTLISIGMFFILYQLLFTNNFVGEVIINNSGNSIEIGYTYIIWLVWFCILMPVSIFGMFKEYFTLTGPAKEQAKYIIVGASFPILGTAPTNAILPLFGIYQYIWIGPFFLMAMSGIVAYGLTRTRFISRLSLAKVLLQNIFFGLILYLSFYLIAHITILYTGDIFSPNSYLLGILITFFAAPFFLTIVKGLGTFVSRKILRESYDPISVRDEFLKKSSMELSLDRISTLYISTLNKNFSISKGGIAIIDTNKKVLLYEISKKLDIPSIEELFKLASFFDSDDETPDSLILDEELFLMSEDEKYPSSNQRSDVLSIMKKYKIQMVIPTSKRASYFGVFLLGEEKDGKILKIEELSLLNSISNSASVAIGRALLHKEVESFNKTLEEKIDKATVSLKEKNEQLQKLFNDLENLYQREKDLMDIAGHEIRTPASIIKTNLSLLQTHIKEKYPKDLDEKTKTYFKRLIESTERQIQIINSFLETSRLENEHFVLQIENYDLVEIIDEAIKDSRHFAKEKGLKIIFNKPSQKIHADVDIVRIREVLDNLIGNAIKYTQKGYIEITVVSNGKTATTEIRDTGVGIDKEDQEKLFKKFSRIDKEKSGIKTLVRPGGTGLGLYVSKGIVEEHRGKIWVKSSKNNGASFFFQIPLPRQ